MKQDRINLSAHIPAERCMVVREQQLKVRIMDTFVFTDLRL